MPKLPWNLFQCHYVNVTKCLPSKLLEFQLTSDLTEGTIGRGREDKKSMHRLELTGYNEITVPLIHRRVLVLGWHEMQLYVMENTS